MGKLIAQRLALGFLTLFGASVLIFAGTELLPGDLASALLQNNATEENLAVMRKQLGLDRPAPVRYVEWFGGALKGDLGKSLATERPVAADLAPRLRNTIFLAIYAAVVAVPLAIALGLLAAVFQGSVFDRAVNTVTLMTISIPEYLVGYLLMKYISVQLGWLPTLANVTEETPLGERFYLSLLPMLTLVLVTIAHMMRMTRASVLAIMASPYIEMAFLKGIPKWIVVVRHAFPNALAPVISVVALNLAYLIVGVVVVESVFVYPGLGQLMVDAVSKHDVPVVQACGLLFASAFIVLNMLADIAAILANPRLRHPR
ncbi:MAG: ABC transporter permease [Alphaproteobacteria bacterium]|nr:ABC transporter permease [Alphaproteobacteria bacterium]